MNLATRPRQLIARARKIFAPASPAGPGSSSTDKMAAVFRTLVSSQEPIYTPPPRPFWKKDSPASRADSKMENEEHTTSSPGTPSGKKLNIFRRRKNRKNMLQQSAAHDTTTTPALDATSPTTNSSGFAVTRGLSLYLLIFLAFTELTSV